jgi:hypothetical protein
VTKSRITVTNPARGQSISFRVHLTDKKGNTSAVTIYDAYYGR